MEEATKFKLDKFVTVGGEFSISGDFEAQANQMLKMGTMGGAVGVIAGEKMDKPSGGQIALLSDEGPELGGEAAAPLPLQYLLAGVAF